MSTTLAIGPANYAGQAHRWSAAAERYLDVTATSFAFRPRPFRVVPGPAFSFPSDRLFPHPRTLTRAGRRRRLTWVARHSHIALDGFLSIGRPAGDSIDSDIAYLQSRGKSVALLSHGSDLRHPDLHRDHFEHSYFNHTDDAWNDMMRTRVERNQRTLQAYPEVPLFVSTPDQLVLYPQATWLPLCVDEQLFDRDVAPLMQHRNPVVLHIPTRRDPPIKGTHLIDPMLRSLAARGVIEYISPSAVSHLEMMRMMAKADVVIDQLLVGAYGVTSVEAMALGRVVVCAVSDEVRKLMPEAPPIMPVSPDAFEATLLEVLEMLDDPAARPELTARGREFAKRWHDGRAAASALESFLQR